MFQPLLGFVSPVVSGYYFRLHIRHCGMWPSGIGAHMGWNRLWVLAVFDTYPMFIKPTITRVQSGFSGYIWLDRKIVLTKIK